MMLALGFPALGFHHASFQPIAPSRGDAPRRSHPKASLEQLSGAVAPQWLPEAFGSTVPAAASDSVSAILAALPIDSASAILAAVPAAPAAVGLAGAGAVVAAAATAATSMRPSDEASVQYARDVPYKEAAYDPAAADAFFRARPLAALGRAVQLTQLSGAFVASVLLDTALKRSEEEGVIARRSQELLELVTALGPTFIKVGQALSIRTDLLPAPYVAGLTQLQDNVPPFSAEQGRAVIEQELGISLDAVFSEISLEPVASASIGQVYKGTLRATGEEVAVKVPRPSVLCSQVQRPPLSHSQVQRPSLSHSQVQRPSVLYNVALDLFMMRALAPAYQKANDVNTDLVGPADAWGSDCV